VGSIPTFGMARGPSARCFAENLTLFSDAMKPGAGWRPRAAQKQHAAFLPKVAL
jgi:hypothetical protein